MKKLLKLTLIALIAGTWAVPAFSQCETWLNKPNKDAIEEAQIWICKYLGFVKSIKTKIFANPNLVLIGLNKILQHNVKNF